MKTDEATHLGFGALTSPLKTVGLTKAGIMEALKLGAGATVGIVGSDLVLSRLLVKDGAPIIPVKWAPAAIALSGIMGGALARKFVGAQIATGIVAGTVGLAISEVIKRFTAPAAAATNAAAASAEVSGYGAQTLAGFGAGRAFAPGLGGFAGLGRYSAGVGEHSLYGVGTPDMSANRMFNGATVAIEDSNQMNGATVQYEDNGVSGFAGSLN